MACVLECFQLNYHILKELHNFLHMMVQYSVLCLWIGDKIS
jgi:hypothetical protein